MDNRFFTLGFIGEIYPLTLGSESEFTEFEDYIKRLRCKNNIFSYNLTGL